METVSSLRNVVLNKVSGEIGLLYGVHPTEYGFYLRAERECSLRNVVLNKMFAGRY
jgi:hypothetical protein